MNPLTKISFKALTLCSISLMTACQKDTVLEPTATAIAQTDTETLSTELETRAAQKITIQAQLINEDDGDDNGDNNNPPKTTNLEFFGTAALQVKNQAGAIIQNSLFFMNQPQSNPFSIRENRFRKLNTQVYTVPNAATSRLTLNITGQLYESNENNDDLDTGQEFDDMGKNENNIRISALSKDCPLVIKQKYRFKKEKATIKYTISVR